MTFYLLSMVVLGFAEAIFVFWFLRRSLKTWGLYKKKSVLVLILAFLSIVVGVICSNMWSVGVIILLHLLLTTIVLGFVLFILKRIILRKKEEASEKKWLTVLSKMHTGGVLPVVLTLLLFLYGFFNMQEIARTEYTLMTDKTAQNYKIVLITDTHYDTIQNTEILKGEIERINAEHPDVVILAGDIVEEETSRESMQEVFEVLGNIHTTEGIYYVYGNHDRQPYASIRTYEDDELVQAIESNDIQILEDSYVEINDDLVLAGREDAAWGNTSGRAPTADILHDVDKSKYIVVADHQPIEVVENEKTGVNLEVSGHTHAGQIWPIGIFSELAGVLNYGEYKQGGCTAIVSSGFTGWGYPIRTEEHCEYVVINLETNVSHE